MSFGDQPGLSVAIITFNEQENITDCLESILDMADEIIVLDSFSNDDTEKICRRFPKVRFEQHAFDGHIQQKNRALELCRGTWVLCLDADERVSPELQIEIKKFLHNPGRINGVKFPRRTSHSGEYILHGGWYPNRRFRLIRSGFAKWGGENPHDYLIIDGPTTSINGDLLHHTCRDLSEHVQTVNKFTSSAALEQYNAGKTFSLIRMIFGPIWIFLRMFCIRAGFLDGMRGFTIAVTSSYYVFLREAKLHEMSRLGLPTPSSLGDHNKKAH